MIALMDFYGGKWSDGYCFYSKLGENKSLMNTSGFNYSDDMVFNRQQCEGMIRAFKTYQNIYEWNLFAIRKSFESFWVGMKQRQELFITPKQQNFPIADFLTTNVWNHAY